MQDILSFIKYNNIDQIYISKGVINNVNDIFKKDQFNYNDNTKPTLFYGLYNYEELYTYLKHNGPKFILWCGTDANLVKLKKLKNSVKNANKHICISEKVYENLVNIFDNSKISNLKEPIITFKNIDYFFFDIDTIKNCFFYDKVNIPLDSKVLIINNQLSNIDYLLYDFIFKNYRNLDEFLLNYSIVIFLDELISNDIYCKIIELRIENLNNKNFYKSFILYEKIKNRNDFMLKNYYKFLIEKDNKNNYINLLNNNSDNFYNMIKYDLNIFSYNIDRKYACAIIESRKYDSILSNLYLFMNRMGIMFNYYIICTDENYNYLINKINNKYKKILEFIKIIKVREIKNGNEYANLLTSLDFWNNFQEEYVLIYQTDSFIFKNFDYDENFLKYDFSGAPYKKKLNEMIVNELECANGGTSFRNVKQMKNVINKINYNDENLYTKIIKSHCKQTNLNYPEDIYFVNGLIKLNLKIPDWNFCFEKFMETCLNCDAMFGHNSHLAFERNNLNWNLFLIKKILNYTYKFNKDKKLYFYNINNIFIDKNLKYNFFIGGSCIDNGNSYISNKIQDNLINTDNINIYTSYYRNQDYNNIFNLNINSIIYDSDPLLINRIRNKFLIDKGIFKKYKNYLYIIDNMIERYDLINKYDDIEQNEYYINLIKKIYKSNDFKTNQLKFYEDLVNNNINIICLTNEDKKSLSTYNLNPIVLNYKLNYQDCLIDRSYYKNKIALFYTNSSINLKSLKNLIDKCLNKNINKFFYLYGSICNNLYLNLPKNVIVSNKFLSLNNFRCEYILIDSIFQTGISTRLLESIEYKFKIICNEKSRRDINLDIYQDVIFYKNYDELDNILKLIY